MNRWLPSLVLIIAGCTPTGQPTNLYGPQGGGPGPSGGGATDESGGAVMAGDGTCPVANFSPSPGLESCFDCMIENCCAELQACDRDPDCVYCTSSEGQIDSSERCVDPSTFSVYPNRRGFADCQLDRCVSPCGATGVNCTPQSCSPSCPNYSQGCR